MKPDSGTRDWAPGEVPLCDLPRGTAARVVGVDAGPDARRRLLAVGVRPGAEVRLLGRAWGGDPLEVLCGGVHLMLRVETARTVRVRG